MENTKITKEKITKAIYEIGAEKVLSTENRSYLIIDSEFILVLSAENVTLGVCGINFGLETYYKYILDLQDEKLLNYKKAIEYAKNKFIVTQMQATGKKIEESSNLRKKINFRKVLLDYWKKIEDILDFSIDCYLPANLNYWKIPPMEDYLLVQGLPLPTKNC
jgi:hypothetical protein